MIVVGDLLFMVMVCVLQQFPRQWLTGPCTGALVPPHFSPTQHCFPLDVLDQNPFVHGVDGVVQAYRLAAGELQASYNTQLICISRLVSRTGEHGWSNLFRSIFQASV